MRIRPNPDRLLRAVRLLAASGVVTYTNHALQRMSQRGFDVFDVVEVLKHGSLVGDIEAGAKSGEWKLKIVGSIEGSRRKMGVVAIVFQEARLIIKTTEWEDR